MRGTPRYRQGFLAERAGIDLQLDQPADRLERVAEQEPRPLERPEQVAEQRERRPLDPPEQQGRPAGLVDPPLDGGGLQVGVDLPVDDDELPGRSPGRGRIPPASDSPSGQALFESRAGPMTADAVRIKFLPDCTRRAGSGHMQGWRGTAQLIPNASIAAIRGSKKNIGSTRSAVSPETSRKSRLISSGIRGRRAPLSIPTWSGSASDRPDLMWFIRVSRAAAILSPRTGATVNSLRA